jgi:3'-phosphoadenosine 5'-phosphosulfate sulfotransferase (PAPS reductase)/FAD synthetase
MTEDQLKTIFLRQRQGLPLSAKRPMLKPISFWSSIDTHKCLRLLPHSKIYDMGYDRTGCMFCMFGVQCNSPNKFEIMKETHPRLWAKALPAFGIDKVCKFMGIPYGGVE